MTMPRTLQDLTPEAARFCLDVERFVIHELDGNGRPGALGDVLVGLSGGADSTALLLALHWLGPRLGCRVCAAHLDHGLRPESGAEAEEAAELCSSLGIPFATSRQDVAALAETDGLGLEEAARRVRYAFLERVRAEAGAEWIAVGHTLDDLAEDVLMRLVRGTGWPALGGMPGADAGRRLLRPLLMTPRHAVESFLGELGIPWTEDASNTDLAYLRNRIRHTVLPLLKRENPLFAEGVGRLWRQARLDEDWMRTEMDNLPWTEEPGGVLSLPLDVLRRLPAALRLRACKQALERLGPGQPLAANLFALDEAVMSGSGGKSVQFPGSKTVEVGAGTVRFLPAPGAAGRG